MKPGFSFSWRHHKLFKPCWIYNSSFSGAHIILTVHYVCFLVLWVAIASWCGCCPVIHASFAKPDRHTKILQNSLDTYEKTSLLPRGKLSHRALINGKMISPFSSLFLIFLTSHLFSCQRLIHISLILCSKVFYGNF